MGDVAFDALNTSKLLKDCQVVVGSVVKHFGHQENWKGRKGGYFCVADGRSGIPLLVGVVGDLHPEKMEKCMEVAQEKARRLALQIGHVSSWQSRDPDHGRWGGAIRIQSLILSFSGLPEMADEAVMLGVALMYGRQQNASFEDHLAAIASLSENPYWDIRVGV